MSMDNEDLGRIKTGFRVAKWIGGGLLSLLLLNKSCTQIEQTERGLVYQFGKLKTEQREDVRQPGLNWKIPFIQEIKTYDISQQHMDLPGLHTYTQDNQPITADVSIIYETPESELIWIAKNNPNYKDKLERVTTSYVKGALGHTEAEKVARTRDALMVNVTRETEKESNNLLHVHLIQALMPNYKFDPKFDNAIAQASNAKAKLQQLEIEAEQAEVNKKKTIIGAEAAAQSVKVKADADLYAKNKQAEGLLSVQKVIGAENMATYLFTNEWDGKTPAAVGTANWADVTKFVPQPGK